MLSLALYIGLCYQIVAPHLIQPGMTFKQVEAILGEQPGTFMVNGDSSVTTIYWNRKLIVSFGENGVSHISHRKKK